MLESRALPARERDRRGGASRKDAGVIEFPRTIFPVNVPPNPDSTAGLAPRACRTASAIPLRFASNWSSAHDYGEVIRVSAWRWAHTGILHHHMSGTQKTSYGISETADAGEEI